MSTQAGKICEQASVQEGIQIMLKTIETNSQNGIKPKKKTPKHMTRKEPKLNFKNKKIASIK